MDNVTYGFITRQRGMKQPKQEETTTRMCLCFDPQGDWCGLPWILENLWVISPHCFSLASVELHKLGFLEMCNELGSQTPLCLHLQGVLDVFASRHLLLWVWWTYTLWKINKERLAILFWAESLIWCQMLACPLRSTCLFIHPLII